MNSRRMLVAMCTGAFLLASCANSSGSNIVRSEGSTTAITSRTPAASATTLAVEVASGGTTTTTPTQPESDTGDVPDAAVGDAPFVPLDLAVGTCFDDPHEDVDLVTPDDIPIVECDSPHANEVFDSADIGEGEFPGASAVQTQAETLCLDAFEAYVGVEYPDSVLDFSWYFPTAESWTIGGTNIICFAYNTDLTNITGSVEATER